MATTDSELITEVRALTNYSADMMTDSTIQELISIGKEELEPEFGDDFAGFYSGNTAADRALFWFTCIATKVRTGEIAGINLTVGSIRATSYSNSKFDFWFENFEKKLIQAQGGRPVSNRQLNRDNRAYGDNA